MGQLLDTVRALQLDRPETWVPDLGPVQPDTLPPSSPSQRININFTAEQPPPEEDAFRQWYGAWADRFGMNPDPDAPEQHYDYRSAFKAGVQPPNVERGEHWPSTFKTEGHTNLVVGGFHTQTGERVPGTPRASSVEALIQLGWDPETAKGLMAIPEPPPTPPPVGTIGPPKVGTRYLPPTWGQIMTSANPLLGVAEHLIGAARPQSVARQDPYGIQAWEMGAGQMPGVLGTTERVGDEVLGAVASRFPRFAKAIKAYHGSPHDFEKFSLEKIGTGEGAQAYGHGLYFAEAEGTARTYRDTLAAGRFNVNGEMLQPAELSERISIESGRGRDADFLRGVMDAVHEYSTTRTPPKAPPDLGGWVGYGPMSQREGYAYAAKTLADIKPQSGRMYEVNIHADPAHFLDWDAPLSQQSEHVKDALGKFGFRDPQQSLRANYERAIRGAAKTPEDADKAIRIAREMIAGDRPRTGNYAHQHWDALEKYAPGIDHNAVHDIATSTTESGEDIYRALQVPRRTSGNPEAATEALREAGIPGIKYLDQGSRTISGGELIDVFKGPEGWQSKIRVHRGGDTHFTTSAPHPTREAAEAWAQQKIANPGTRNYVVFDDALIDILKKYGLSAATIGLLHRALNDRAEHDQ